MAARSLTVDATVADLSAVDADGTASTVVVGVMGTICLGRPLYDFAPCDAGSERPSAGLGSIITFNYVAYFTLAPPKLQHLCKFKLHLLCYGGSWSRRRHSTLGCMSQILPTTLNNDPWALADAPPNVRTPRSAHIWTPKLAVYWRALAQQQITKPLGDGSDQCCRGSESKMKKISW